MACRIMLTADVHLGMGFAHLPAVCSELSKIRYQVLEQVIELANREQCDLLVIAGDLFERLTVPKKDVERAAHILDNFEGAIIAVLPGNHDYYSSQETPLWNTVKNATRGKVLVLEKTEIYSLQDWGIPIVLYPAPCDRKHSQENRIGWIKRAAGLPPETWHIGVVHGSLKKISPDYDQKYFPMEWEKMDKTGLDLWLAGHTHIPYPASDSPHDQKLFIPGTPEPDGFDCSHNGGVWCLELQDGKKVKARRIATGQYRFVREEWEIASAQDLRDKWEWFRGDNDVSWVLMKLELKGAIPPQEREKLNEVIAQLNQSLFYVEIDENQLDLHFTKEQLEQEFTQASFPYVLLSRLMEENNPAAVQTALEIIREVRK